MPYQYVAVDRQTEPTWVNTALTAGVAVTTMAVVYSALAALTAPAAPTYLPVSAMQTMRAPRVAPLNAGAKPGSGAWFDKAFAKSTAASEGWPGGEEDLKGPAGEDAAPRASNRGGKKAAPAPEKKGLFGFMQK
jgi:hypothetical protein|eukprot:CAMPEP_0174292660 /NCGR_PEP_ID=MMETSP0809-20121228/36139_1 /TAXON_ID=73025 ORGANISM="Eutreptiella gymnastica-like, Strain CCMP1594" /NCGR_SAMPLE_ID=MMETSP0809 /ASSEMBLY_ACC=CAM_ASM_000658 /LENGTH=133 /DNA_ID=CAMNT_0015392887 /DNA_START=42 /DNA_END=443 /DNA_ORIENTATION=+